MVNEVELIGYIGHDPEYVSGAFDANRATFGLATSETFTKKNGEAVEHTYWHDCTAWGFVADRVQKLMTKGCLVRVKGKLTYWEQEKEGIGKIKRANIKVETFHVLKFANPKPAEPVSQGDRNIVKKVNGMVEQEKAFEGQGRVKFPDNTMPGSDDDTDDLPF
jgi:single-strand DNA-binding protein